MNLLLALLRRYWLHIAVVAVVSLVAWRGYVAVYERGARDERGLWQAKENKALAEAIAERDLARRIERDLWSAVADITAQNEQDKRDAQAAADRLAADLRAGNVKLRNRWQGCQATGRVSGAAASAAESDAAARDREESAGRAIRAADEADATIRALQKILREERK